MLTPAEQTAWEAYVTEMAARDLDVDLTELLDVFRGLEDSEPGRVIADALGVGTMPLTELAQRLTLQTRHIVQTGHVPAAAR